MTGRSTLKEGHAADLVVFDAATVHDTATYDDPMRAAKGIDAVIVNGMLTWRQGVHTGARSGQVITRTPAS